MPSAEARKQCVEVGAVLVLLGLSEHYEAATAGDKRLDGRDLLGGEHRRAADRALPLGSGRMRDDEHVGIVEHAAGQRAARVRRDLEVALREGGRGGGIRSGCGMLGPHGRGGVRPDRPRLAVGLIEDDASHLALAQRGTHQCPPLAGHGEAAVAGRRTMCGVPVVPWPAPELNPGRCADARRACDAGGVSGARRRQASSILVRTSTVPPPSGLRRSKSSTTARMMEMPMPPSLSLISGMFWHSGQSTSSS